MKTEILGKKARIEILFILTLHINVSLSTGKKVGKSLLRTPGFGYAAFLHHPYSKLNVDRSDILQTYAEYPKHCALGCARNFTCKSFNFGTQPMFFIHNKPQYICHILSTDKYNASSKFVSFHGDFHHYSIRSDCNKSPCLYNSTCVPIYYEDTYKCLCSLPGLVGKHCRDADECSTNQNNCSVNATCSNTIGSYNCTCKPGYVGDGKFCKIPFIPSDILKNYGNQSYINELWGFLGPAVTVNSKWIRCWWASDDGWDVTITFHKHCDNQGPTLTIVRKDNYVYGGYIDKSWDKSNAMIYSTNAFLFSLFNIRGYYPIKLQQDANGLNYKAAYYYFTWGPTFGGGYDLLIKNNAGTTPASSSRMASYYPPPGCTSGNNCDFFNGHIDSTTLSDVEVFYFA